MKMKYVILFLFLSFFAVLCFAEDYIASDDSAPNYNDLPVLRVGVVPLKPMIWEKDSGKWTGFVWDLWEMEISRRFDGYNIVYVRTNIRDVFDQIAHGELDLALGGITATEERLDKVDFSYSYLTSGLRLLVQGRSKTGFVNVIEGLRENIVKETALILLGLLLVASLFVWLIERELGTYSKKFSHGYVRAFRDMLDVATTLRVNEQLRTEKTRWLKRVVLLFGIIMFSVITAAITKRILDVSIDTEVRTFSDLNGRSVAAKRGSTSIKYLEDFGAKVIPVNKITEAVELLKAGKVKAIVHDRQTLEFLARQRRDVHAIGVPFSLQPYAFPLRKGSPHRDVINRSILHLSPRGTLSDLCSKWFSEPCY